VPKYNNPVGQCVVLCVCLLIVGLVVGYGYAHQSIPDDGKQPTPTIETQQLPVNFILRPVPTYVYDYLANAYAAHDKNQLLLLATWDDWCLGVTCEHWILKTHPSQLPIMLRCYPDFDNQCVPTVEQGEVRLPDGNKPTITPVVE
jgi:hypothetical protein